MRSMCGANAVFLAKKYQSFCRREAALESREIRLEDALLVSSQDDCLQCRAVSIKCSLLGTVGGRMLLVLACEQQVQDTTPLLFYGTRLVLYLTNLTLNPLDCERI